jgi:hypothetical protein
MKEHFWAVDVGDGEIRCVEVNRDDDRVRILRFHTAALHSALPTADDLRVLAGETTPKKHGRRPRVYLSLPSRLMTARAMDLPPAGDKETRAAVEFELREVLDAQERDLYWDYGRVSLNGRPSDTGSVFALATLPERVKPYLDLFKEMDTEVEGLVPSGLAGFYLARTVRDPRSKSAFLVLTLKPGEAVLTLGTASTAIFSRVLPSASLSSFSQVSPEVERTIDFFRRRFEKIKPDEIIVAADPAVEISLAGDGETLAGLPVRKITRQDLVMAGGRTRWGEDLPAKPESFFSSLGLALAPHEMNLLPRRQARRLAFGVGRARETVRQFIPALLLLVIVLATWVGGNEFLSRKRAACIDRGKEIQAEMDKLKEESEAIREIARVQVPWSGAVRMIGEAQKNGVETTEFSVDEKNKLHFKGKKKGSVDDINKFIGKLEENSFIKDPQFGGSQAGEDKIEFTFTAMLGVPKLTKETGIVSEGSPGQPPSEAPLGQPGSEGPRAPDTMRSSPPSEKGPEESRTESVPPETHEPGPPPSTGGGPSPNMVIMPSGGPGGRMRMEDLPPEIRERMAREMEKAREERGTP